MKVLIHNSYFSPNFGDVLLWKIAVSLVKEAYPSAEIVYENMPTSCQPYYIRPGDNIDRLRHQDLPVDLAILAGGGYLSPPGTGRTRWAIRNYFRHVGAFRTAANARLAVILGVGAGPFDNLVLRKLVSVLLRARTRLRFVRLRDSESVAYWSNLSKAGPEAVECMDLAFTALTAGALGFGQKPHSLPTLHCDFSAMPSGQREKFIALADEMWKRHPGGVQFLIDCPSKSGEQTYELFRDRFGEGLQVVRFSGDVGGFLSSISSSTCLITSKLHVGICSIALDVPTISVPAHKKTRRFYDQLGMGSNCLDENTDYQSNWASLIAARLDGGARTRAVEEYRQIGAELAKLMEPF